MRFLRGESDSKAATSGTAGDTDPNKSETKLNPDPPQMLLKEDGGEWQTERRESESEWVDDRPNLNSLDHTGGHGGWPTDRHGGPGWPVVVFELCLLLMVHGLDGRGGNHHGGFWPTTKWSSPVMVSGFVVCPLALVEFTVEFKFQSARNSQRTRWEGQAAQGVRN